MTMFKQNTQKLIMFIQNYHLGAKYCCIDKNFFVYTYVFINSKANMIHNEVNLSSLGANSSWNIYSLDYLFAQLIYFLEYSPSIIYPCVFLTHKIFPPSG